MAMLGLRPIVEMMTMNFAIVAADQILNHAAKVRYFSGGQVDVPMVIRGPQGAGVQLSAQHSQSFESFYAHFPGIASRRAGDAGRREGNAEDRHPRKDPVIFLESAALYGMKGEVPDDPDFTVPFGMSRVAREGQRRHDRFVQPHAAAVAHRRGEAGEGRRHRVRGHRSPLAAAARHGAGYASVAKTHRARRRAGAVEAVRRRPRRSRPASPRTMFDELDAPVARVTGEDVPMPYARNLELLATPHEEHVIAAVKKCDVPGLRMAEIIMPKMGDAMTEGKVVRWYKKPGDAVKKGEPVLEIETDKVNLDLEAEHDGTLGDARREGRGDGAGRRRAGQILGAGEKARPKKAGSAGSRGSRRAARPTRKIRQAHRPASTREAIEMKGPRIDRTAAQRRLRRRATGRRSGGRRTLVAAGAQDGARARREPRAGAGERAGRTDRRQRHQERRQDVPRHAAGGQGAGGCRRCSRSKRKTIPLTAMRRTIAKRLAESTGPIPHFYLTADYDVTNLLAMREQLNEIDGVEDQPQRLHRPRGRARAAPSSERQRQLGRRRDHAARRRPHRHRRRRRRKV